MTRRGDARAPGIFNVPLGIRDWPLEFRSVDQSEVVEPPLGYGVMREPDSFRGPVAEESR